MSARDTDRVVHGWTGEEGGEIVRYDRAGKWYIEYPPDTGRKRLQVSVEDAARAAIAGRVFSAGTAARGSMLGSALCRRGADDGSRR